MKKYNNVGINEKTYELLKKRGSVLAENEYGSKENTFIINAIKKYTEVSNENEIIKKMCENNAFYYDNITNTHNLVVNNEYSVPFELISENLENVPKNMKNELESSKRTGRCHKFSIALGLLLESSKVVTGIIKIEKNYYLHSVVELVDKNTNKIKYYDYTRNLVIEKEKYLQIFEFKILNEINSDIIIQDMELLKTYGLTEFSCKLYLVFRNEIIESLEKNSFILDGDKNKRAIKL